LRWYRDTLVVLMLDEACFLFKRIESREQRLVSNLQSLLSPKKENE
jgi:hypothetical protein